MNQVVSFEKTNCGAMKVNSKTRRCNTPGIIERQEMFRAEIMELTADLKFKADKEAAWYSRKYGLDY